MDAFTARVGRVLVGLGRLGGRLLPAVSITVALAFAPGWTACVDSGRSPSAFEGRSQPFADGAAGAEAASGGDASAGRYLALGDSFTIGTGSEPSRAFPARLVERWRARGCVLTLENVAVNGYTTADVIARELPVLASLHPTFVTVAIGANDIVQGHSVEVYRANVRRILEATKASGARTVVLPQPDWSRSPAAAVLGAQAVLAEAIRIFNAVLAEEARARGAEWVDLGPLMQQQAVGGELASDGLHPSAAAYDAWAAELARVLASPCR